MITLTETKDATDQARAKLHTAFAYALLGKSSSADSNLDSFDQTVIEQALPHLTRVLSIDSRVGITKDIDA